MVPEPIKPPISGSPTPEPTPVVTQPEPEKELFSWTAPERLFKKRDREYYTTVGVIVLLLSVILLFAKEFLLIAVILSFGFVSYVLASVPPGVTKHRITNKGIRTGKNFYRWGELGRFWFVKKWKQLVLHVENAARFPGQLVMVIEEANKEKIKEILSRYLINQKPEQTLLDRAAKWLQKKVPLEG
jgi:hypothetical protein